MQVPVQTVSSQIAPRTGWVPYNGYRTVSRIQNQETGTGGDAPERAWVCAPSRTRASTARSASGRGRSSSDAAAAAAAASPAHRAHQPAKQNAQLIRIRCCRYSSLTRVVPPSTAHIRWWCHGEPTADRRPPTALGHPASIKARAHPP